MTSAFKELGATGLEQWGGVVMVERDPKLQGILGVRVYDQMRLGDPTGMAMYLVLSLPIRKVEWSCIPGGSTVHDEEAADFAWSCFGDMSHTFGDLISDVCLMFPYGWAYFDMSVKRRSGGKHSQFDDGRVGFRKIAYRHARTLYYWEFDEEGSGDILGMWQLLQAGMGGGSTSRTVYLPLSRSLLFRTMREGDNPEGWSIYRPAVRPWRFKQNLERVEGIGLYRRWAGFPIIHLPDGATTREDVATGEVSDEERAEDLVKAIYQDRMMGSYLPQGWSLDFGGPEGTVDPTMSQTIIRKDAEMTRAILAQYLLLGLKEVGTQALAQTLLESFTLAVEAFLQVIRDELNRYAMPYLFGFSPNEVRGMTGYPQLTHTSPRNLDLGQVGQYIQAISMAGGLQMDMPTQRFLRSLVPGMPTEPEVIPTLAADQQPPPTTGESQAEEGGGDGNGQKPEAGGEDQHVSPPGGAGAGGRGSGSGSGGAEHFQGKPDPDDRAQIYTELVDAHSAAQRQILENWTGSLAGQVSELPDDATEGQVRDLLDDVILTGLLLMRERSVLDIAVAFWLGFGAPSGGPQTLAVLQSEVANNDSWLGYDNGQLRYTNPLGKPSLWGDIAGQLEGQIAAILLLLKEGRRDDVLVQIQDAVRGVTQGYHRAELYGGAVWHAIWAGVGEQERVQWEEYGRPPGPVRWVMNPFAIHCVTCLEFGDDPPGREYVSWFDMTQVTGGILPGVGTVCDGRCRCHLEAFVEGRGWCWL